MDITISLSDLGVILLWVALLTLIVYIILVLKRFNETMKEVQAIITDNKENIEETLAEIPSIAKNVDDITAEVSHDVKAVRSTIDNITEKGEIASASLGNTGDLITGLAAMIQVFMFIREFATKTFGKKRRVL